MATLVMAVMAVWLLLLTLACVGLNVRLMLLRKAISEATPTAGPAPAAPTGEQPALANAAVLVVDETCVGCSAAIDAFEQVATAEAISNGRNGDAMRFVVLSPDPEDSRLAGRAHLRLVADPELYRRLYPGLTPSVVVTDSEGSVVLARPAAVEETIRCALDDALVELSDLGTDQDRVGQGGSR